MNPMEGGNYHISIYAYASTHILLIPPTTHGFFSFSFFFFSDSVCDFCYVTINNLKNTSLSISLFFLQLAVLARRSWPNRRRRRRRRRGNEDCADGKFSEARGFVDFTTYCCVDGRMLIFCQCADGPHARLIVEQMGGSQ